MENIFLKIKILPNFLLTSVYVCVLNNTDNFISTKIETLKEHSGILILKSTTKTLL